MPVAHSAMLMSGLPAGFPISTRTHHSVLPALSSFAFISATRVSRPYFAVVFWLGKAITHTSTATRVPYQDASLKQLLNVTKCRNVVHRGETIGFSAPSSCFKIRLDISRLRAGTPQRQIAAAIRKLPSGGRVISVAHRMAEVKSDESIVVDTELDEFDAICGRRSRSMAIDVSCSLVGEVLAQSLEL
jgi:hypothetical protein